MKIQKLSLSAVALLAVFVMAHSRTVNATPLGNNESIRLNFTDGFNNGADNFNFITAANGGIAAGSVMKSDGTTATGVSVSTAGWAGDNFVATTPGVFPGTGMNLPDVAITGNPGTFTNQVTNFFFDNAAAPVGSLTIGGLTNSPNLLYDVYVYGSIANAGANETTTVSVNGGTGIASTRTMNTTGVAGPNYTNYLFEDVTLDGGGNIVVSLPSSVSNSLLNAAIIVAREVPGASGVPEPSTMLLCLLGGMGLTLLRRNRRRR